MGVFCLFVFVVFFVKKKVCSTDSAKKKFVLTTHGKK